MSPLTWGVLVFVAAAPMPADAPGSYGQPVAGVAILSPDGTRLYVPNRIGGLDAIELATGKQLWHHEGTSNLALATADRVAVWAPLAYKRHLFNVVLLDAKTGKPLVTSAAIGIPNDLATGPAPGKSFKAAARLGGDILTVYWEAEAHYWGGTPPPTPNTDEIKVNGAVEIDTKTGRVTPTRDYKVKPEHFATAPVAIQTTTITAG
jgi:hypothetical protein